jgi:DNA-binding XRE family transcriptional regulator
MTGRPGDAVGRISTPPDPERKAAACDLGRNPGYLRLLWKDRPLVTPSVHGGQIKAAGLLLGWSQSELAAAAGVAVQTIQQLETRAGGRADGAVWIIAVAPGGERRIHHRERPRPRRPAQKRPRAGDPFRPKIPRRATTSRRGRSLRGPVGLCLARSACFPVLSRLKAAKIAGRHNLTGCKYNHRVGAPNGLCVTCQQRHRLKSVFWIPPCGCSTRVGPPR